MINIREAVREDASAIVAFQLKMAMETEGLQLDEEVLRKGVAAVFDNASRGKFFVAEQAGKVIGSFLITYEWSDWRNGQVIWMQSVYVDVAHRRKGVFRKMYGFLKQIVEHNPDYKGIRLYVERENINAQRVYSEMGMIDHHYNMFEWMA